LRYNTIICETNLREFAKSAAKKGMKKGQATFIAPLQPLTLAPFPSWGI